MMTLTNWFGMHGYGVYLWPAYGVVGCTLAAHAIRGVRCHRRVRHQLQKKVS